MYSCTKETYHPQDCDLIFQVAEATDFSKAITDATAHKDVVKFDHVAMVVIDNRQTYVIEASAKNGVSMVLFDDFVRQLPAGFIVKRVKGKIKTKQIIEKAKSHLGEPYDWSYLPDNGKMYCSDLIYESFVNAEGNRMFQAKPMNFRDSNGQMPQFWTDLFAKLGEEIPEGVLGTNPNE